jgi:hypothetical protein
MGRAAWEALRTISEILKTEVNQENRENRWRGGRSRDFKDAYWILICLQIFHSRDYITYKHQHQSATHHLLPGQTLCLPNLWWYYLCDLANPRLHWNYKKIKKLVLTLYYLTLETLNLQASVRKFSPVVNKEMRFSCFVKFREIPDSSWESDSFSIKSVPHGII